MLQLCCIEVRFFTMRLEPAYTDFRPLNLGANVPLVHNPCPIILLSFPIPLHLIQSENPV